MAIRGQRFQLDLDSDDEPKDGREPAAAGPRVEHLGLIRDITERSNDGSVKAPSPPRLKSSQSGFPAHKKRSKSSSFKQQRLSGASLSGGQSGLISRPTRDGPPPATRAHDEPQTSFKGGQHEASSQTEKQKIDHENRQRLADMAPEEIERERQELMSGLSSSLIERLLKRANIDEGRTDTLEEPLQSRLEYPAMPCNEDASAHRKRNVKQVIFDTPDAVDQNRLDEDHPRQPEEPPERLQTQHNHPTEPSDNQTQRPATSLTDPDRPSTHPPTDLNPATSLTLPAAPTIHFPLPPTPSLPLDPSDPSFLAHLHQTYFPHLPTNPAALAWLSPLPDPSSPSSPDTPLSPYSPHLRSFPPSALRFDFRGRLLPPKLAAQLPVTMGLHHHGDAPEAAGYTISELAHLSRSSVPGQRCVAFQTLGRVLYRLGRGDFGGAEEGNDDGGGSDAERGGEGAAGGGRELYLGLWKCVEEGRVLETLMEAAGRAEGKGNRSCWVTATEAVWLWRRGGGKKVRAG